MPYATTTTPTPRGSFIVKFTINEIVYDITGKVWKILSIKNTTNNPIFVCEGPITTGPGQLKQVQVKEFIEDNLVKVAESTSYFNALMDNKISYYEEMLNKIEQAKNRLGG